MSTSVAQIRRALAFISPDLARDDWVKIGMALKVELGETGREVFSEWSAHSKKFNEADTRSAWKSFKPGGKIGIGTLFHLAKQSGYTPDRTAPRPPPPSHEALARAKAQAEAEDARVRLCHSRAARISFERWNQASQTGTHAYLSSKGITGLHGARIDGATLLVPMRDTEGILWNTQLINPKPTGGFEKRFLPGSRKAGLFCLLGDPPKQHESILICEGFATGASCREAMGLMTVCAFDTGNLLKVGVAIRAKYPGHDIVFLADNDIPELHAKQA